MRYRSTATLCDHLKFILSMPELCDVTFLVGEKRLPVHGVKAILGARSEVFYRIIQDCQRKYDQRGCSPDKMSHCAKKRKMKIEVNKYKPEDFRHLVQFVHCGKVKIGDSNLPGTVNFPPTSIWLISFYNFRICITFGGISTWYSPKLKGKLIEMQLFTFKKKLYKSFEFSLHFWEWIPDKNISVI